MSAKGSTNKCRLFFQISTLALQMLQIIGMKHHLIGEQALNTFGDWATMEMKSHQPDYRTEINHSLLSFIIIFRACKLQLMQSITSDFGYHLLLKL